MSVPAPKQVVKSHLNALHLPQPPPCSIHGRMGKRQHRELHQPGAAVTSLMHSACKVVGLLSLSQDEFEAAATTLILTSHQLGSYKAAVLELGSGQQINIVGNGGVAGRVIPENCMYTQNLF